MRKLLVSVLVIPALVIGAGKTQKYQPFQKKLTNPKKVVHALNRLTFGPRPGDADAVRKAGLKKWIDQQLHPERIAENPELEAKLKPLDSLTMDMRAMFEHYPPPQVLNALSRGMGRNDLPKDPVLRARIERLAERYKRRRTGEAAQGKPARLEEILEPSQADLLRKGTPEEKIELVNSLPEEKLETLFLAMPANIRQELFQISSGGLQRKLLASTQPLGVIQYDLTEAKLLRAAYGNRQLEEVLVDFWYNHFNVDLTKGSDRYYVTSYERDAIRPHVLGRFKELLLATAQHPAMLFYLDNWTSVAPPTPEELARMGRRRIGRGLNENYARELMELHTLGVDGGYTQKDVIEVARCLTGWTIKDVRRGGAFEFNPRLHDKGEKVVLGHKIAAGGGIEDGLTVIDILMHHPSTALFISKKLCQRFVADDPPPALVEKMAKTFRDKDGDLRAVMKTMLSSRESWSEGAWRAKMKSPLEMVASAVCATGAKIDSAYLLANQLQQLGEPLYRKQEPTGYSSVNAEWTSTAALLARMNFALALVQNKVPGVQVDPKKFEQFGTPERIARSMLFTDVSAETREAIARGVDSSQPVPPNKVAGLVIGSPEFQRR